MPIYAWGSNGSGQLAVGHVLDLDHPTSCLEALNTTDTHIEDIAAGGNHTLILDTSGRLYAVGAVSGHPIPVEYSDIKLCSATWDTSVLCTRSDQVIVFGKGERGELGCGPEIKETSKAITIDLDAANPGHAAVVQLASGVQHTVAVLSDGSVVGWGSGRKGQLGEPADIIWKPRKISGIDFKVLRAACGQGFTFLVGEPELGQFVVLGQDKFGVKSAAPKSVVGWEAIDTTWSSISVLTKDGTLTSWGRSDQGQQASPIDTEIVRIALGSEHALALGGNGKLYAYGWGEHGNCGPDTDEAGDAKVAKEIELPSGMSKIRGIGAGCATSWIWT